MTDYWTAKPNELRGDLDDLLSGKLGITHDALLSRGMFQLVSL